MDEKEVFDMGAEDFPVAEELVAEEIATEGIAAVTPKNHIPKKEFWMYAVAAGGQGMVYAIMSSYISDFYITVMQLPLVFIMLLMLLARVWDAINDPLMGIVVDKCTTPWGKMKPYVLFTAVPIAVLTFFMFYDPQFASKTDAMIYAAFIYVFWGMIYTASDVPFWTLPNVMTPDPAERGKLISVGRTVNGIGSAIPMAIFLVLGMVITLIFPGVEGVDLERRKYMIMAIVCAVIGTAIFVTSYFFAKERVVIPNKGKRLPGQPSMLKRIFTCKPLMLVVLMGVLSSGRYMMQAASVHVARYAFYIGPALEGLSAEARTTAIQQSISTVSTIFTICSAVGMFGAMLFMPKLFQKFDYKKIVIVTCIAGFLASCLTTVLGALSIFTTASYLVYVCIPFIIVQCIPLGALNVTSYAMVGDCLDYLEWSTGFRDNALGSACQSFVNKLGNALATTMIVIMYMIIALDPSQMYSKTAVVAATELDSMKRFGMFSLVSLIPGASLLLCSIPIFWYDLVGAKKDKITAELAERRAASGIAVD